MMKTSTKWAFTLLLFVATVALFRISWDAFATANLRLLGYEPTNLAVSLHDHGTFADPFGKPTGPSAFIAPLYPMYIALLMNLFGTGGLATYLLQWTITLALAVHMALLPWIAERIGLGFLSGVIASAALILADPPRDDAWEAWPAAVVVMLLAAAMVRLSHVEVSNRRVIVTGLCFGVSLLLIPVAAIVLPLWLTFLLVRGVWDYRRSAVFCLCVFVGVSPWIIRNFMVFHRFIYVRDNLGVELVVSNNDCATYSFNINQKAGCFAKFHPNENAELARHVGQVGELEFNRESLQTAKTWIRNHPAQFRKLTRQHFEVFWFPSFAHKFDWIDKRRHWVITLFTLLSIPGLFLFWKNARPGAEVILAWLTGYPAVYYIVQYIERYRTPLLWMSLSIGSYAVIEAWRWMLSKARSSQTFNAVQN